MRDPDLVLRAQRAAAALEEAWHRWRTMHGLGVDPLPPVSSYVGYSLEEPWGQPRVVFGVDAEEAEQLAAVLDGHDCFGPVHALVAGLPGSRDSAQQPADQTMPISRVQVPMQAPASPVEGPVAVRPAGEADCGRPGKPSARPNPLDPAVPLEALEQASPRSAGPAAVSQPGRPGKGMAAGAAADGPVFRAAAAAAARLEAVRKPADGQVPRQPPGQPRRAGASPVPQDPQAGNGPGGDEPAGAQRAPEPAPGPDQEHSPPAGQMAQPAGGDGPGIAAAGVSPDSESRGADGGAAEGGAADGGADDGGADDGGADDGGAATAPGHGAPDGGIASRIGPNGSVPGASVPGGNLAAGGGAPGGSIPGRSVTGGSIPGASVPGGSDAGGSAPGDSVPGSPRADAATSPGRPQQPGAPAGPGVARDFAAAPVGAAHAFHPAPSRPTSSPRPAEPQLPGRPADEPADERRQTAVVAFRPRPEQGPYLADGQQPATAPGAAGVSADTARHRRARGPALPRLARYRRPAETPAPAPAPAPVPPQDERADEPTQQHEPSSVSADMNTWTAGELPGQAATKDTAV